MNFEAPQCPGAVAPERFRWFEPPGARLRAYEWGDPKAPPVLLAHGFFDHGRGFDLLAPILAERYRVVSVDSRGHGSDGAVHVTRLVSKPVLEVRFLDG